MLHTSFIIQTGFVHFFFKQVFHLDNKLFYFRKLIKKFWEIDENHNLCFPVKDFINQLYFVHLTYSIHFVVTWGVRNLIWIHGMIRTNPQTIWARTQEWMRNCTGLPNEMHKYSFLYTPLYSQELDPLTPIKWTWPLGHFWMPSTDLLLLLFSSPYHTSS